jgi:hypothetical protein
MFILSFMGTMPFGNLLAGAASHRFGAPHTLPQAADNRTLQSDRRHRE